MHTRPLTSFGGECRMHTRPRCLKLLWGGGWMYTRPVPRQFLRILDSSWLNLKFGCFFTNSSWLNVKFGSFFLSGEGVVAHSSVGVNFFTATR